MSSVVAELLFLAYPNKEEGFLSKRRSAIVARKHLNLIGRAIIPVSEIKSRLKPVPPSVFGNALEALVGAIYIDKGIGAARIFIQNNIYNSEFLQELLDLDFKSKLLKYSQKEGVRIKYQIEKKEGLDHQKKFLVSVIVNGEKITQGAGYSKKEAEQMAAKKAINNMFLA